MLEYKFKYVSVSSYMGFAKEQRQLFWDVKYNNVWKFQDYWERFLVSKSIGAEHGSKAIKLA